MRKESDDFFPNNFSPEWLLSISVWQPDVLQQTEKRECIEHWCDDEDNCLREEYGLLNVKGKENHSFEMTAKDDILLKTIFIGHESPWSHAWYKDWQI